MVLVTPSACSSGKVSFTFANIETSNMSKISVLIETLGGISTLKFDSNGVTEVISCKFVTFVKWENSLFLDGITFLVSSEVC